MSAERITMAGEATLVVVGNLVDDPELRYTKNGTAVAEFTVANTPRTKNSAGAWENETSVFYRCSVWSTHAENVAESLKKGQRVLVRGGVHDDSYTNKDGQNVKAIKVVVEFVGPDLRFNTASVAPGAGRGAGPSPRPAPTSRPSWGPPIPTQSSSPDAPPF